MTKRDLPDRPLAHPGTLYIGGKWTPARDGDTSPDVSPVDGRHLVPVAQAGAADVESAVAAARRAYEDGPWGRLPDHERARLLTRVGELIERDNDEIALLETVDMGKPFAFSSTVDVPMAARLMHYYAGLCTQVDGATRNPAGGMFAYTRREPLGVVAAITPFNFPLLLSMTKIGPALAAGNTVVHKPSPATPLTALKIAELFEEAGVPDGVLNVITGPGVALGEALVEHPGIDKIAFTGSTSVGQGIIRKAAATLKKVTMELGGKSANIVFADADLDAAEELAFFGIFYNKGEICTAGSRLLLHRSVHDEMVERLVARAEALTPGDPREESTLFGPLAHRGQFDKVSSYVELGQKEGAELRVGGGPFTPEGLSGEGLYFLPTIFTGVDNGMRIAQEEIFGPVLGVIPFDTEDEAVRIANDSAYGLAAGVHTEDLRRAHRVAERINAGTVWVNCYDQYDPAVPYGGYRASGFGRECGPESLESYTQTKSVWIGMD
ncbi:aldehyde dehydrogenase family protein [Streptomyces sp. NPDC086080]|uniref:aldehyde dehydrogenase family protein n=1 Tax=Streptomyces sp. NPDC086080 TaxID=3365748 RepID=UPI0037CD6B5C